MPVVKFLESLDLDPIGLFLDRHAFALHVIVMVGFVNYLHIKIMPDVAESQAAEIIEVCLLKNRPSVLDFAPAFP